MINDKQTHIDQSADKSYIELDRLKLDESSFKQNEFLQNTNSIKWKDAIPQVYSIIHI